MFERAQRVFEDRLGTDHPLVVENLTRFARLLRATGEQAEAERLETRAAAAEGR